jgi:signal peptidase I
MTTASSKKKDPKSFARVIREWVVAIVTAFVVLTPIRSSIVDWNDVPSGSMEPTILTGDRIIVNKLAYGLRLPLTMKWITRWSDPKPGDVVILFGPKDGVRLVKRVVGKPGDTIELRDGVVHINGTPLEYTDFTDEQRNGIWHGVKAGREFKTEKLGDHPHTVARLTAIPTEDPTRPGSGARRTMSPVTLGPDQFWVMGDNRDQSNDSRYYGPVNRGVIVGRSSYIAFSVDPGYYYLPRFSRWFSSMD